MDTLIAADDALLRRVKEEAYRYGRQLSEDDKAEEQEYLSSHADLCDSMSCDVDSRSFPVLHEIVSEAHNAYISGYMSRLREVSSF